MEELQRSCLTAGQQREDDADGTPLAAGIGPEQQGGVMPGDNAGTSAHAGNLEDYQEHKGEEMVQLKAGRATGRDLLAQEGQERRDRN